MSGHSHRYQLDLEAADAKRLAGDFISHQIEAGVANLTHTVFIGWVYEFGDLEYIWSGIEMGDALDAAKTERATEIADHMTRCYAARSKRLGQITDDVERENPRQPGESLEMYCERLNLEIFRVRRENGIS